MKQSLAIALITAVGLSRIGHSGAVETRVLSCNSTFPPNLSSEILAKNFGSTNITSTQVDVGEGAREFATIIFPDDPKLRIEIFWKDPETKQKPRSVRVRQLASNWHTDDGLSIGTDLLTIERMNRKPFRLAGFAWDYSGTVVSWSQGVLSSPTVAPCRLVVRLAPDINGRSRYSAEYKQVLGDREYSSGHPAMQLLNPRVYELLLVY